MSRRVYELAKELEVSSRDVIQALAGLGFVAKSHSSTVEEGVVLKLLDAKEKGGLAQLIAKAPPVRAPRERTVARPSAERTAAERPSPERPSAERPSAERAPAPRPSAERAPAPRPSAERPSAERAPGSRPSAERAPGSRPSAERPSAERVPAPRPSAERVPAPAAVPEPAVAAAGDGAEPGTPLIVHRGITVQGLAAKLEEARGQPTPPAEIIKKLFLLGETYTVAQSLTDDAAELVGSDYGYVVTVVSPDDELVEAGEEEVDDEEALKPRPPVITVMGHVDHGKTLLLDKIRQTDVVAEEAGGITQHIGAYQVRKNDRAITFIDTPGHEAFTQMRARGAKATDIAVLVVAADDGVKPQTIEALNHAKAAEVPIVVAVNKIDKEGADPSRVRQQLTEHELIPEEWGGSTVFVDISAKQGTNIDQLLEMLLLVADIQDLKANPEAPARGVVIEAHLDKGRGPVATVLVERGTLRKGDTLACGTAWARVRAMLDDVGQDLTEAGPGTPGQVLGFDSVPEAGDEFRVYADERRARQTANDRASRKRAAELVSRRRVTLEDVFEKVVEGELQELLIVLKADVQGSLEAIQDALEKLKVEDVAVRVLHRAVGGINENDVTLAAASGAIIAGFNVRPAPAARTLAEREGVEIRLYQIIYKLIEDIEAALKGMLRPVFQEVQLGRAEVRQVFRGSSIGVIAGSHVEEGVAQRGAKVRLLRDNVIVIDTVCSSLFRFKDAVKEVQAGYECGIGLENFADIKEGDSIEFYEVREIPRT